MVGESDQNVFLIQIDAPSFAKFELSEFEISRVDCILLIVNVYTCMYILEYNKKKIFVIITRIIISLDTLNYESK